jgi:hypothetical protein
VFSATAPRSSASRTSCGSITPPMTPTTAMILSSSCVDELALEVFTGWKTQGRTSDDVEVHPFARMAAGDRNEADRTSHGCSFSPQTQPDPAPHLVPLALELAASSSRESSLDATEHGTRICLARIVGALPTVGPKSFGGCEGPSCQVEQVGAAYCADNVKQGRCPRGRSGDVVAFPLRRR